MKILENKEWINSIRMVSITQTVFRLEEHTMWVRKRKEGNNNNNNNENNIMQKLKVPLSI